MAILSIHKCNSYDYKNVYIAVEKIFNDLGGIENYIKPGNKVVLKPNLLMKKKPGAVATTHPTVVKAVCELVQKAGGIVTIAESPGGPYNKNMLKSVYKACGIEKVANETGAILNYNMATQVIKNDNARYIKNLKIIQPLVEADVIINLPKLKTHMMMVYTGAVKNMFGAIAGIEKADYHMRLHKYDDFANAIIDIFLSTKTTINIMDAVIGMEGYGPSAGNPKHIGVVMGSENAFEMDYVACKLIDLDINRVFVIKEAIKRDLLNKNGNTITYKGEILNNVKIKDFKILHKAGVEGRSFFEKKFVKFLFKDSRPKPVFDYNKCIGCGICSESCPPKIIKMNDRIPNIEYNKCIRCFCCHELCPHKAISIKRNFISKLIGKS